MRSLFRGKLAKILSRPGSFLWLLEDCSRLAWQVRIVARYLLHYLLQEKLLVLVRHFIAREACIEESSFEPGFCVDLPNNQFLHWIGKLV